MKSCGFHPDCPAHGVHCLPIKCSARELCSDTGRGALLPRPGRVWRNGAGPGPQGRPYLYLDE